MVVEKNNRSETIRRTALVDPADHNCLDLFSVMAEVVRRSTSVRGDYCNQALQAALEMSMQNICGSPPSVDSTDMGYLGEVQGTKSLNITQCVAVPSSEHVAEIVGRQGKI